MPNQGDVERGWKQRIEEWGGEVSARALSRCTAHYLLIAKLFRSVFFLCLNFSGSGLRRIYVLMVVSIVFFGFFFKPLKVVLSEPWSCFSENPETDQGAELPRQRLNVHCHVVLQ